jgi:hypothetical protein
VALKLDLLSTTVLKALATAIYDAGTIIASAPRTFVEVWNNSGITFVAKSTEITDTASATASLIERWQVGGVNKMALDKAGNVVIAGTLTAATSLLTPVTVSALPSAATAGIGARAFVTDSTATTTAGIGATVTGSGSNKVPVYSDGTNWKIG